MFLVRSGCFSRDFLTGRTRNHIIHQALVHGPVAHHVTQTKLEHWNNDHVLRLVHGTFSIIIIIYICYRFFFYVRFYPEILVSLFFYTRNALYILKD